MDMIEVSQGHTFALPIKKINEGSDLSFFLTSSAYTDVTAFLAQLNHAMFPMLQTEGGSNELRLEKLDSQVGFSHPIIQLQSLLQHLGDMVNDVPPDSGPRRFGNVSFRRWYETLEERSSSLLTQYLPRSVNEYVRPDEVSLYDELRAYFLGSFGSAQRLDYGTGHELSFLAFIGGLWKLDGFQECREAEKEIVLGVVEPYLELVRKLIKTYTLEPAGSHGVWGLDDHSFLPYIFGSAQFGPAIGPNDPTPLEGSLKGAPKPSTVTDPSVVEDLRAKNMYYSAIGFIYDVKKGPFWEHSPYLYDISGIEAGWGKINKGMMKMFKVEVLSKFPVVQHFPFGSLFRWTQDPRAAASASSAHADHQPVGATPNASPAAASSMPPVGTITTMPSSATRRTLPRIPAPKEPSAWRPTKAPWAK